MAEGVDTLACEVVAWLLWLLGTVPVDWGGWSGPLLVSSETPLWVAGLWMAGRIRNWMPLSG